MVEGWGMKPSKICDRSKEVIEFVQGMTDCSMDEHIAILRSAANTLEVIQAAELKEKLNRKILTRRRG